MTHLKAVFVLVHTQNIDSFGSSNIPFAGKSLLNYYRLYLQHPLQKHQKQFESLENPWGMHHPCRFYIFRHRGQGAIVVVAGGLIYLPWPPAFMAIWQQLATSMDMTCCYVGFGDLPRCYMMLHEQNWSNMSFITGRDLFWGVLWVSEIPMYPLYFQVHSSEA